MKINKSDFIKWSEDMTRTFHAWEVMIPCGAPGKLDFRQEKFVPEEYENAGGTIRGSYRISERLPVFRHRVLRVLRRKAGCGLLGGTAWQDG